MKAIEVSAGLVFQDGRLLIAQRPAGTHLPGLWEFPGGKRQPGESPEDCLCRELREELGCEIAIEGGALEIIHPYEDRTVCLRFFQCRITSGVARPLGCAALAWVTRDQLSAYRFPAADERLLEWLRSDPALWVSSVRSP